uniref:Uncharacterized protein n=1 Tax=Rhizophora mucronata TaxID=61149 RepID=A0A2P2J0P4_RHIMU
MRPSSQQLSGRQLEGDAALFILGDSYLDAGNNNYIDTSELQSAGSWPYYGRTHFKMPTGRFSDGRVARDFIGET